MRQEAAALLAGGRHGVVGAVRLLWGRAVAAVGLRAAGGDAGGFGLGLELQAEGFEFQVDEGLREGVVVAWVGIGVLYRLHWVRILDVADGGEEIAEQSDGVDVVVCGLIVSGPGPLDQVESRLQAVEDAGVGDLGEVDRVGAVGGRAAEVARPRGPGGVAEEVGAGDDGVEADEVAAGEQFALCFF